ncbi:MAG: hypothetical protein AAF960_18140 [Bacteroidota bacterium]
MKSKAQKNTAARKIAEAAKAKKKAIRDAKAKAAPTNTKPGGRGRSAVPQSKKKK